MDINLSAKLLKYSPAEVQKVTYVVEYASHNCEDVREIHEYIEEQLKSSRLIEIADIILENKNMATINAKPSGASGKIDSVKEKSSTEGPVTAAQRSISGKKVAKEEFLPEEESDRMNDRRLERGGMGAGRGTTHTAAAKAKSTQSKSAKPDKNTAMSALEIVKRATEAKYGKGSIMSSYEADGEEDLQEGEGSYGQTPKARQAMGKLAIARREKPASEYSQKGEKTKKVKSIEKHTRRMDNGPDVGNRGKKSTKPRHSGFLGKSGRGKLDQDSRDHARDSAVEYTAGGHKPGSGTVTKNPKKLRKQKAMGEIGESYINEAGKAYGGGEDPCWKGYKQVGMKMKNGSEVPNCVPVSEAWMWELVDELAEDFDFLTQEDLEDVIIEAMVEIEDDVEMLDEALDMMSSYDVYPLFEDYYAAAASKSKENAAKPEVKAAVRRARVEKVKTAAKAVGSTLKSKADSARAKVGSAASSGLSAVSAAASKAGASAKSAASSAKDKASKAGEAAKSAASSAKKGIKAAGKKVVGAASRAAGHAVGEYQAARIKAKRDSLSKSKPKAQSDSPAPKKPESKDAETRRKGEELLDKIRASGGQKKSSSSSGGGGSSSTTTTTRSSGGSSGGSSRKSSGGGSDKPSLLRRAASAVKRGIKKVVGKTARAVSSGAGKVASRMGEETTWRDRLNLSERGDFWHPDPEQDRKLGGPGANQRAREDRAAASAPKKDYSKSLKPGETYMQFAKRKQAGG